MRCPREVCAHFCSVLMKDKYGKNIAEEHADEDQPDASKKEKAAGTKRFERCACGLSGMPTGRRFKGGHGSFRVFRVRRLAATAGLEEMPRRRSEIELQSQLNLARIVDGARRTVKSVRRAFRVGSGAGAAEGGCVQGTEIRSTVNGVEVTNVQGVGKVEGLGDEFEAASFAEGKLAGDAHVHGTEIVSDKGVAGSMPTRSLLSKMSPLASKPANLVKRSGDWMVVITAKRKSRPTAPQLLGVETVPLSTRRWRTSSLERARSARKFWLSWGTSTKLGLGPSSMLLASV